MRTLFLGLLLSLVISCQGVDKKAETANSETNKTEVSEKYQMDVFQIDENNFNIICLNKLTGVVFVRNNNGTWYNAQDMKDLKKYDMPVYSMKVIKGTSNMFQIVLFNGKNGNVYVRSYASSWYEASGIRSLEN